MFSGAVSGVMWQISRQVGQRFLCLLRDLTRQTRQKECPQEMETGSQIMLRHREHSKMEEMVRLSTRGAEEEGIEEGMVVILK